MLKTGPVEKNANSSTIRRLLRLIGSTPRRSFVLYPMLVIAFESFRRAGLEVPTPYFLPLLVWGYLEYRLVGDYRQRHKAGSRSFGEVPEQLLQEGPFRFTRNPMYLGHLIFMLGLALSFESWLGAVILLFNLRWFHQRVLKDEALLQAKFGPEYDDYRRRAKRWIPFLL